MTSPLNLLLGAARSHPTAECFVVSDALWTQIERDAEDYLVQRSGDISTVQGLGQMAVLGVPVTRTRSPLLKSMPWAEMLHRPNGHSPEVVRLL